MAKRRLTWVVSQVTQVKIGADRRGPLAWFGSSAPARVRRRKSRYSHALPFPKEITVKISQYLNQIYDGSAAIWAEQKVYL